MKVRRPWVIAFLLAAACPTSAPTVQGTNTQGPAKSAKARLKKMTGEVMFKREAGDQWLAAMEELELFENDKVRTAAGAGAVLDFPNGTSAAIGEDALLSIAETRAKPGEERTDLTVHKGQVNAKLEDASGQSLTVSTPAATVRAGRELVFR